MSIFFPLTIIFILGFFFLLGVVILLIEINILSYAYEKVGIHHRHLMLLLLGSLLGSSINIPVVRLPAQTVIGSRVIKHFGMEYVVPVIEQAPYTMLAVNVGGALIPTLVSIYLLRKKPHILPQTLLATTVMAVVMYWLATPVPGMGIAVPTLLPPFIAASLALLIDRANSPPIAYIAGSMGVLIGADLMNLTEIAKLGAAVASIGGAGTFDGIFLTGIVAVLLA